MKKSVASVTSNVSLSLPHDFKQRNVITLFSFSILSWYENNFESLSVSAARKARKGTICFPCGNFCIRTFYWGFTFVNLKCVAAAGLRHSVGQLFAGQFFKAVYGVVKFPRVYFPEVRVPPTPWVWEWLLGHGVLQVTWVLLFFKQERFFVLISPLPCF